MKFQAVIFDLFGTLVDNFSITEHNRVLSGMAVVLEAPEEPFTHLWLDTFHMRCVGEFQTTVDNVLYICEKLNTIPDREKLHKAANIRFNYTRNSLVPKNNAIKTLKTIKTSALKLGLISDCSSEVPAIWQETSFADFFDVTLFSCEQGIKKPDSEIYLRACRRLGVLPNQCLYVGDGSSNELYGAQSVGMVPVLIKDVNETNAHRIDAEPWDGEHISKIEEVLNYI